MGTAMALLGIGRGMREHVWDTSETLGVRGWELTAVVATKTIPWLYKSVGISLPGGWEVGLVRNVLRCKKKLPVVSGRLGHSKLVGNALNVYEKEMDCTADILAKEIIKSLDSILYIYFGLIL